VQIHIRFEMDPNGQIMCTEDSDCPQKTQGFLIDSMCDLKGEWSSGDVCVAFSNQDCLEIHSHEECQFVTRQKEVERRMNTEECKGLSLCERHCTVRSCLAACQQKFVCLPPKPVFAAPLVILDMVKQTTEDQETIKEENKPVSEEDKEEDKPVSEEDKEEASNETIPESRGGSEIERDDGQEKEIGQSEAKITDAVIEEKKKDDKDNVDEDELKEKALDKEEKVKVHLEDEKQFEKTDIEAAEEAKVKTLSTLSLLEEEDEELEMEKSLPRLEEVTVIKEVNSNIVEVAEGQFAVEEEDVRI